MPHGYYLRIQLPLAIGERNQPDPDLAVVQGSYRDYEDEHPTTAALIVEVADSSLPFDRNTKASLYARAGVAEYWLVDARREPLRFDLYRHGVEGLCRGSPAGRPLAQVGRLPPLVPPDPRHQPGRRPDLYA